MTVRRLYAELLKVTRTWDRHTKILPGEDIARTIGHRLYEIGGEGLMQTAYYHATAANPVASNLSLLWHNIGGWRW